MIPATTNGAVSHWFAELPTPRPPLPGDRDADVCIVGAGFTGLWTAYSLKRLDPALRVTVLDCTPTGLVVITGLKPADTRLRTRMPDIIDRLNRMRPRAAALEAWLAQVLVTDSRPIAESGRWREAIGLPA